MRCPNCGAKFQKTANICLKCGTKMSQIEQASNEAIIKAKKEYQPEKIVYSTVFPKDLNYKKTLLLAIFLGMFGAHRYYTKQYLSAILMSISMSVTILFWGTLGLIFSGNLNELNISLSDATLSVFCSLTAIIGAITVLVWAFDVFKLATKKYKVPVVLAD